MPAQPSRLFSTWPPAEDVPAFRGQGAPGRRCALRVLLTMVILIAAATALGHLLGNATGVDRTVSEWFVRHRSDRWNTITRWMSDIADTLTVVSIGAAVVIAGLLRKARNGLIVLMVGMVGEVLMFLAITALVSRDRPDVPRLDQAPPTSSFPSGHTFASAVLWGCLAIVAQRSRWRPALQRILVALAILVPASVAVSRMYRGMHHLTDVSTSAVLAAVWLTIIVRIFPLQTATVGADAHDHAVDVTSAGSDGRIASTPSSPPA